MGSRELDVELQCASQLLQGLLLDRIPVQAHMLDRLVFMHSSEKTLAHRRADRVAIKRQLLQRLSMTERPYNRIDPD